MRLMGDHPAVPTPTERREAELLAATHALRDREESERLRQLGGVDVHLRRVFQRPDGDWLPPLRGSLPSAVVQAPARKQGAR